MSHLKSNLPSALLASFTIASLGLSHGPALAQTGASGKTPTAAAFSFKPVPLPNPNIPGYNFPTAPEVITAWTKTDDQAAIQMHAWGIWTALTLDSGERFEGQKLRVFETWETPTDIQTSPNKLLEGVKRKHNTLTSFHQLNRFGKKALKATQGAETVTGFVKYDPIAAAHIRSQNLLSTVALSKLLQDGATSVPEFPAPSVSLKPVFQVASSGSLVQSRYYKLSVWPGPPKTPKPFPSSSWGTCVWVDIQESGNGTGNGGVDHSCKADGSSRAPANTYGLGNFVNFQLNEENAAALKALANPPKGVAVGDYSLLVAMHVTSREIKEWTWQSFWWTPAPDAPPAPSSVAIAALRPSQLEGAPRHYAHCAAYQTLSPPQPESGGQNKGESVYCYNPYLEAGFSPTDLPDSIPGVYQGKKVANNVGVQTNCMSCHAAANYNPKNLKTAPDYSGDRYLSLTDPRFKGTLQVDFLWSIPGNAK